MNNKALDITVYGRVQGVFFRKYTCEKAMALGLFGWVRNEVDGSVSIHAEGNSEALSALIQWCATGSPWSEVDDVVVTETELLEQDRFYIDRT